MLQYSLEAAMGKVLESYWAQQEQISTSAKT